MLTRRLRVAGWTIIHSKMPLPMTPWLCGEVTELLVWPASVPHEMYRSWLRRAHNLSPLSSQVVCEIQSSAPCWLMAVKLDRTNMYFLVCNADIPWGSQSAARRLLSSGAESVTQGRDIKTPNSTRGLLMWPEFRID